MECCKQKLNLKERSFHYQPNPDTFSTGRFGKIEYLRRSTNKRESVEMLQTSGFTLRFVSQTVVVNSVTSIRKEKGAGARQFCFFRIWRGCLKKAHGGL